MSEPFEADTRPHTGSRLAVRIFTTALVIAAIASVLTEFVDPEVWGIADESSRILYIGGLGLLAGLAGLVAVLSGLVLAVQMFKTKQGRIGRTTRWLVVAAGLIVLAAALVRFYPR